METFSSSSFDGGRPMMKYDVFISFRGKDVRYKFVDFLYDALDRLGIKAFMDDKRLKIGDPLEDLLQTVEESRSAIVVLSKDYASAKWCLRELTRIMDSMKTTTMDRVLPVFYHVEPSNIKDECGTFKKSFDEHEANALKESDGQEKEKHLKEIQNWRKAVKKICNHTGVVITKNSSEVEVVKKIANQIFYAWRPKLESFNKNLVGMTSRLLQMNIHLALGLDDIRFVAIVGMGGIGKTTIAKVVFDCLLSTFDDHCFLTLSGSDSKQSLVSLQREMLSKILHTEDFILWHENDGVEIIKSRLSGRKVLLVLDGIEEKRQLEMLIGGIDWFGPGSRVIITTRNKELLNHPNYVEMKEYNVEELDNDSALQLFLKHAFGTNHPNNNFMDLSRKIIEKVKRLPLALRVIGSFLYGKEVSIWKETLKRLIKVDEKSFFDVLKISYDGLGAESQQVFLDLACFFNRKREDRVVEILESFGYSPKTEILLLMQRCLLEVSHDKILLMHDLILEMGQEIVLKESLTQPEKQTRIWVQEHLYLRFAQKHGLKYIQGIVLNLENERKELIQLDAESFSKMTSLRIMEMNNVELSEDIKYLSQLLRVINWPGYPSTCLPPTFQSKYLFELLLPQSQILQLWVGKKNFEKLKVIDVSRSEHLRKTPDFSGVPNLEKLILYKCVTLCEIHPSINSLDNLILLDLKCCANLEHFPSNISCKKLRTLFLSGTALETSPKIGKNMEHLTQLHLDGSKITHLHPSIENLIGLALLNLSNCYHLLSLPCEIGNLKSLKTLLLEHCRKLDQIPPSLANVESLEKLSISETSITHVPSNIIHCFKNLENLECKGLSHGFWKSLLPQFNIRVVSFGLRFLKSLNLSGCNLIDEDIPKNLHYFSSLEILNLSYNYFVKLSDSLSLLNKLKILYLNYCSRLQKLPKLPDSLRYVEGEECISISNEFYNKRLLVPSSSGLCRTVYFPMRSKSTKLEYVADDIFNVRHKLLSRRFIEENISDEKSHYFVHHRIDIFKWFDQKNEGRNWINIQHNQEFSSNNNVCGVFLSANIECQQTLDPFKATNCKLTVSFEIEGNPSNCYHMFFRVSEFQSTRSIWIAYIPSKVYKDGLMVQSSCSIKAIISCENKYAKVKACGASTLSWQDASERLAKFFTKLDGPKHNFQRRIIDPNHKSKCRCDELEVAKVDDFSPSTFESDDPTFLLRKNHKSILCRMLEGRMRFHYFFPQTKIPEWFRNQKKKEKVAVKLPVSIQKDKKWIGLAMFVIFSVFENAKRGSFDYEIQSDLLNLSKKNCCIPIELLQYSNQILFIVFEPKNWYPYQLSSSCNHLYISFNTNVERMQVELCGARLVYQQNVEGLIRTIVDCVVESGDYEYYNTKATIDLLRMMKSDRHKASSLQNASMKNPQPNTVLSSNSSTFSVEQLLHASFPHPLLHKNIEERFGSQFNITLHGDTIPDFFTNQRRGNIAEMKFSPYLDHQNPNFVGVAVCVLVVVDRQNRKLNDIPQRQRYTKVLDLICKFRVDSCPIWPVHYHFVSQEKVLSEYASNFIWLFYIPLDGFNLNWYNCNQLGITAETSCDELFGVQSCGLHLIHKNERKKMVNQMIMESIVPPPASHKGKGPQ